MLVENYSVGVLVVLGVQGVVIVSSSLLGAPMPTRSDQGYADNLTSVGHTLPTRQTLTGTQPYIYIYIYILPNM